MPRAFRLTFILCMTLTMLLSDSAQASRLKDIVSVEGVRDNLLVGYGLVVGLNGTGDNLNNTAFTQKGLVDFLERLGVNTRGSNLKTKNIAAVTVTASLPAFARQGSRMDVSVSTLGDAKSLQGGTLLATPLVGADGEVYAVAQGSIAIGGFVASSKDNNTTVNKGVATNGSVPSGAIVEKEINFSFDSMQAVKLALHNPDISTSLRIAEAINQQMGLSMAKALDPGTVELRLSDAQRKNIVELLSSIEHIDVNPDTAARVIIDEASGTIVMGENVKVSTVAVAQGNLTITVKENPDISQPGAFAPGGAVTAQTAQPTVTVDEQKNRKLAMLTQNADLRELVDGLNALGVGPRDMITILQNIKAAGALQADIEVR